MPYPLPHRGRVGEGASADPQCLHTEAIRFYTIWSDHVRRLGLFLGRTATPDSDSQPEHVAHRVRFGERRQLGHLPDER